MLRDIKDGVVGIINIMGWMIIVFIGTLYLLSYYGILYLGEELEAVTFYLRHHSWIVWLAGIVLIAANIGITKYAKHIRQHGRASDRIF